MNLSNIKNLIFDLGGVIINLDTSLTVEALAAFFPEIDAKQKSQLLHSDIFLEYEKGFMDDVTFRNEIRRMLNKNLTDEEIDAAWNKMLLDIPVERVQLLRTLGKKYKMFLLSNTNAIHIFKFNEILTGINAEDFFHLFDKVYFSHQIQKRKPDREIFEYVLKDSNIEANETLFLDDNESNIDGAKELNIKTALITSPEILFDIFAGDLKNP